MYGEPLTRGIARLSAQRGARLPFPAFRMPWAPTGRARPFLIGVVTLVLSILAATVLIHKAAFSVGERQSAIDQGLILRPQTVMLTAASGPIHARLQAAPLIPGLNRFTLNLDDHGRPIADARISLTAVMPGMRMRSLEYPIHQTSPGVYAARGSVTMFGRWRFDLRAQSPHSSPFHTTFVLDFSVRFAAGEPEPEASYRP